MDSLAPCNTATAPLDDCAICMEAMERDSTDHIVHQLACGHWHHLECIQAWASTLRTPAGPSCRREFTHESVRAAEQPGGGLEIPAGTDIAGVLQLVRQQMRVASGSQAPAGFVAQGVAALAVVLLTRTPTERHNPDHPRIVLREEEQREAVATLAVGLQIGYDLGRQRCAIL